MLVLGARIAFLPSMYVRSEIHRPSDLQVFTVQGEAIERTHALAWRSSFPARQLFKQIAVEIGELVSSDLHGDLVAVTAVTAGPPG